ncbi:MAG: protein-methionine-sulfoxide reductase catalytic subunit MsrP [Pseudomonadota bacterium]
MADPKIVPSEITAESVYLQRRKFLQLAGLTATAAATQVACADGSGAGAAPTQASSGAPMEDAFRTDEPVNSWEDITTYNNFYEFGTGKSDPARNAHTLVTRPWSVTVKGECARPGVYDLEDILAIQAAEERIYRLRCVEAWSMVVPWLGIPMASVLSHFEPTGDAKYVEFRTLEDPEQMPGQRRRVLRWPYREGLTMAEAMHPLTLMATGLYGKEMPNQNGAPLRLVVPWKYGFKSIKSIVSINFTSKRPKTSWEISAPQEYGFYANVNPTVDHPRWSQARERRIGEGLFAEKRPTLMFNGYAEQVADLYTGLDLRRNY